DVIGVNLDGVVTSWNTGAERLYGYPAADIVGRPFATLVPPERPGDLPTLLDRARRGERTEHYETVRLHKDGRRIDVSITVVPITDAAGRVTGAASIARDVGERKRAEQQLRQSRMR